LGLTTSGGGGCGAGVCSLSLSLIVMRMGAWVVVVVVVDEVVVRCVVVVVVVSNKPNSAKRFTWKSFCDSTEKQTFESSIQKTIKLNLPTQGFNHNSRCHPRHS
jgi:hypothetical protein